MIKLKLSMEQKHKISPYLYMQFMEPLGTTDASVDAAWDYTKNCWNEEVINKVKELSPSMVRFGGTFIDYYHWREGVGKKQDRVPMINHCWGGLYSNHVGTHEIVDFCKKVSAEPLLMVNMESDGFDNWANPQGDNCRLGTVTETAEWVSYCNDANNAERIANGAIEPFNVKYWQIGNETSYRIMKKTGFDLQGCYDTTCRFAEAMLKVDPTLKLIGWGDKDYKGNNWCRQMSNISEIEMLAFHHHFDSGLESSPLTATDYRIDYENTWRHLMNAYKSLDEHIKVMRSDCRNKRLALTEGHFCLPGRNRNEVLSSWGAGVAYARCLNTIMRHSDVLEIATMADFFGNVWQVNAIMLPTPLGCGKEPYFQPVGSVMSLFRKYQGDYAVDVEYNGSIDAVASKTENKYYIHIANTDMNCSQEITLDLPQKIVSANLHYIAEKPDVEITPCNPDVFKVKSKKIEGNIFTLPAASVAVVEIIF